MAPEDRWIDVGGIRTRYWQVGESGPWLLLLHGLGGYAENWLCNVGPLSRRHRVLALDMVGFGRTGKPPIRYTLPRMAWFAHDFLRRLGVGRASVVGLSMGGGVSLQFAIQFPERLDRLVLVDSAGLGVGGGFGLRLMSVPLLGELIATRGQASLGIAMRRSVYDPRLVTPPMIDLNHRMNNQPGSRAALLSALRGVATPFGLRAAVHHDIARHLPRMQQPTLIVWGRNDPIVPVAHAVAAARAMPRARLEVFERCGHLPPFEHADAFNRLVEEFLDSKA